MALLLQKVWHGYLYVFDELTDPRTKSWPLVAKPYQTAVILALYLLFVLKWGPKWMQNRQPFNVDKLLIIYNGVQVIACFYLLFEGLRLAWFKHYKWVCEPVDFSNDPRALEICHLVYFFFMLKLSDLLDTIFFVFRKKNKQISFLHVYHHLGMAMLGWGVITYMPGGHGTLTGVINAFVHVVMYSYYLLTVAMPSIRNHIWIKKIVTQIQLVQFLLVTIHTAWIVFKPDCEYPRWTSAIMLPQNIFMLILFSDFYIKTYMRKPKEIVLAKSESNNSTKNLNIMFQNGQFNKKNNISVNEVLKKVNNEHNNFNNSNGSQVSVNEISEGKPSCVNGKKETNGHFKQS